MPVSRTAASAKCCAFAKPAFATASMILRTVCRSSFCKRDAAQRARSSISRARSSWTSGTLRRGSLISVHLAGLGKQLAGARHRRIEAVHDVLAGLLGKQHARLPLQHPLVERGEDCPHTMLVQRARDEDGAFGMVAEFEAEDHALLAHAGEDV